MATKVRNLLNRNGRYFARLTVPEALRKAVGSRELRTPLGPDRRSALLKLPAAVASLRDEIAAKQRLMGLPLSSLRPLEITEIIKLHYDEETDLDVRLRDLPRYEGGTSRAEVNELSAKAREAALRRVAAGSTKDDETEALVGWAINKFQARGYALPEVGSLEWRRLARELAISEIEVLHRSLERDLGNFSGTPTYAPLLQRLPDDLFQEPLLLTTLLSEYTAELKKFGRGNAAEQRWRPCFAFLKTFLRHDDARRLTRTNVLKWKEKLLETLSPKTVRDSHLAGLKAVLQYAVDSGRLAANVASDVKVRVPKPKQGRDKGFDDAEARAILIAARDYKTRKTVNQRTSESELSAAAKRWAPWICAHTGARIAEVTQLRKEDVRIDDKIPYIRITPDAGSVKTNEFRDVPIHAELLKLGFAGFVKNSEDGPLFYRNSSRKSNAQPPSKQVAGRVGQWVRSLKILPADVHPNHGWRHRFKSVTCDLDLNARVVDAIQGHAPRTAGEAYGSVSLEAKSKAISKIPCILTSPG